MPTSIRATEAGIQCVSIRRMTLCAACLAFGFTFAAVTAQALALTAVQLRKVHGTAGALDIPVDTAQNIAGAVTVEPRVIGTGHQIVFQFDAAITAPGSASATDEIGATVGSVTPAAAGNDVVVTLTGIPDNKRFRVGLTNVNGVGLDVSAAVGFLLGDVNDSRDVASTDVAAIKARVRRRCSSNSFFRVLRAWMKRLR